MLNICGLSETSLIWNLYKENLISIINFFPFNLRNLFAVMLNICGLSEPSLIWNLYKENFSEDFYRREININEDAIYTDAIYNHYLIHIEDTFLEIGGKTLNKYGLPSPDRDISYPISNEFRRETTYNIIELNQYFIEN